MILDCYEFYLWSKGSLKLPPERLFEYTNNFFERNELYE